MSSQGTFARNGSNSWKAESHSSILYVCMHAGGWQPAATCWRFHRHAMAGLATTCNRLACVTTQSQWHLYNYGLYSYGLSTYGLSRYGLYSYGVYSYGLSTYGLSSYGLYSYGLYSYGFTCVTTQSLCSDGIYSHCIYNYGLSQYNRSRTRLSCRLRHSSHSRLRHVLFIVH